MVAGAVASPTSLSGWLFEIACEGDGGLRSGQPAFPVPQNPVPRVASPATRSSYATAWCVFRHPSQLGMRPPRRGLKELDLLGYQQRPKL
jgi:hypothetical protein